MSRFERRYKNALLRMGGSEGGLAVRTEEKGGRCACSWARRRFEREGGGFTRETRRQALYRLYQCSFAAQDAGRTSLSLIADKRIGSSIAISFRHLHPNSRAAMGMRSFRQGVLYDTRMRCAMRSARRSTRGGRSDNRPKPARRRTRSHRARVRQAPPPERDLRIGVGYAVQRRPSPASERPAGCAKPPTSRRIR